MWSLTAGGNIIVPKNLDLLETVQLNLTAE